MIRIIVLFVLLFVSYCDGRDEHSTGLSESDEPDYYEQDDVCYEDNSFIDRIKSIHEKSVVNASDDKIDMKSMVSFVLNQLFDYNKNKLKLITMLSGDKSLSSLSSKCRIGFETILKGMERSEIWALRFIDSTGRFPPKGFLEGVFAHYGQYFQCLATQTPVHKRPPIRGKYCLLKVILPFPLKHQSVETYLENRDLSFVITPTEAIDTKTVTVKNMIEALNIVNGTIFRLGLCLPSVCSAQEVQSLLNKILYPVIRLPIEIGDCRMEDDHVLLDNYQLLALSILGSLAVLVGLATALDLCNVVCRESSPHSAPSNWFCIIDCFSLIKNIKSLFAKSEAKYSTLDTIRLLLILNAHIVHAYMLTYTLGVTTLNKVFTYALPRFFTYSRYIVVKSPLMIDALFTLSGFLLSFTLLRKLNKTNGAFNYLAFILQNWLRFAVLIFGSILFYYVLPLLEDGPVWASAVNLLSTGCKNNANLIKILLFVNNFQEFQIETFDQKCNITLWFMSSLLQYLIIAPIFIITYHKNRRTGLAVMCLSLLCSLFLTIGPYLALGVKPWHQLLARGVQMLSSELNHSVNWFHTTPNVHLVSFLVGICFGFLKDNRNLKMSNGLVKLCWLSSFAAIITMYYWNDTFWKAGPEPELSVLLWHTFGKMMFSTSYGWIFFASCTGRAGLFNRVLSSRVLQPLSRLSFGIYLLHYIIVIRRIFIITETVYIDDSVMWANLIIDFILDFLLALIFHILIECPCSRLFKIIF